MKKNSIVLFSLIFLVFTSCNEKDDSATQWQLNNKAAYEAIVADSSWKKLDEKDVQGPDGVYYRNLKEETATGEYPLQTASVTINYIGRYYTGVEFDKGIKISFQVNAVVRGFGIALQNMRVGDKWDVCIPYYLGYGATSSGSIPAYTTLFFEIELLKIEQNPK